jgi:ammonium transporter, Amt family
VPGPSLFVDNSATAWVLLCAALVMLMTPGIALFYGGMVRRTNVLSVIGQAFAGMAVVSLLWVLIGYSLAFGGSGRFIGGFDAIGIPVSASNPVVPGLPLVAYAIFQLMFAVLAGSLILGAGAERWRFSSYLCFVGVWSLLVYAPVAHWVFDPRGFAAQWGMVDFAGGTVVQITAGAAAIAVAISLGRRRGWPDEAPRPHNLPLVMTGLGLLWFGWLGLTGGSAYAAGAQAATAMLNAQVAAAAGLLSWLMLDRIRHGKPTVLGAASGAVAGLVAITPGAGEMTALAAIATGVVAGILCHLATALKRWFNVDDALDVAAVHLGGGFIGCLCVGLFATRSVHPGGTDGLFYSGGYRLLGVEAGTAAIVAVYALIGTFLIAAVVNSLLGYRVRRRHESLGLDLAQHGESAYDMTPAPAPAPAPVPAPVDAGPPAITAR